MKVLIAKEALVTFPDFSKESKIHMEAKSVTTRGLHFSIGKIVAFYARKMATSPKSQYKTTK
jgi:hypothetical protein